MAKHTGIIIRIGASHDQVEVHDKGNVVVVYDRSSMRKDGKANLQGALRREVVDTWAQMNEAKSASKLKRNAKRQGDKRDKLRREYA